MGVEGFGGCRQEHPPVNLFFLLWDLHMCFRNSRKGRAPGDPVHLVLPVLSIFLQPHSEEKRMRPVQLARKLNKHKKKKLRFLAGKAMVVNKAFGPREYKTSALLSRKRISPKHVCTFRALTAERRSI